MNSETLECTTKATGKHFAIIVSRWNELVTKQLMEGALSEFERADAASVRVIHVPGTWEIPPVVSKLIDSGKVDGVVALGCFLQGQTTPAQLLGGDVCAALMNLQTQAKVPVSWGILTPDTLEQALDRSGAKHGNKGREAALAAIETANVLERL